MIAKAFGAQDADFKTSTDEKFDLRKQPKQVPIQTIYASSQDGMDTVFYRNYKEYAKQMIAGNRNYFCCDMPCSTAIEVYMRGKPYAPLLSQETVDAAMKENPEKARREYYNIPTMDGGADQIVKWATVRRNEKLIIPYAEWRPENRIVMAFDPARTNDNSIVGVMNLVEDPELGLCGDIVNFVNFIDVASKNKFKLDSNRQVGLLRQYLVDYNGDHPDYEYLDQLLIDAGAGGGGVSTYADRLLENWTDTNGIKHRGLIDKTHKIYEGYSKLYRDAVDKVRVIDPRTYRTQMVQEFIELFELGVIRLPFEYSGQEFLRVPKKETAKQNGRKKVDENQDTDEIYYLSNQEIVSLRQIDLMKTEITSIHKFKSPDGTSIRYALPKEKESRMHDDRFFAMILLAHRLYELRKEKSMRQRNTRKTDSSALWQIRAPKLYK